MSSQSSDQIVQVSHKVNNGRRPYGTKASRADTDDLTEFIKIIKQKQNQMNTNLDEPTDLGDLVKNQQLYHNNYKPDNSGKQHIYSIDELLGLSKSIPEKLIIAVSSELPKKSFWRLSSKTSESGIGNHHRHNQRMHNNESYERKHQRGRNNKGNSNRRNSKKYIEEKDVEVNNDELLKLEEQMLPTGNSIADFENWRAKMKELERKRKGLPQLESSEIEKSEPLASANSLSDFFNLKKEDNKTFEELESLENLSATQKCSSSRFSSFFNNSSNAAPDKISNDIHLTSQKTETVPTPGSRLMSLFNKETVNEQHSEIRTAVLNEKIKDTTDSPVISDNSSQFLEGLLNKNKSKHITTQNSQNDPVSHNNLPTTDSLMGNAPPGLSKQFSQVPPHFHMTMPSMNPQVNIPHGNFPNFHMPPPGMFNIPQNKNQQNDKNLQRQFLPPLPGFNHIQGHPIGFTPNMPMPPNGIMPSPHQGFHASHPPAHYSHYPQVLPQQQTKR